MSTFNNTKISVAITHDKKIYFPVVVGEITVEWVRFATPGKMTLTVYKDSALKFREGDIVTLKINGSQFFFGFVFTYERAGDKRYRLTCYDVLRYLKSSDVFKMKKMTYTKALKTACKRYGLKTGSIANTRYVRKGKVFIFKPAANWKKNVDSMQAEIKEVRSYTDRDYAALQHIDEILKGIGKGQITMINHMIDGNNVEAMKKTRDDLLDLTNKI